LHVELPQAGLSPSNEPRQFQTERHGSLMPAVWEYVVSILPVTFEHVRSELYPARPSQRLQSSLSLLVRLNLSSGDQVKHQWETQLK
jgi:hypothetical protein